MSVPGILAWLEAECLRRCRRLVLRRVTSLGMDRQQQHANRHNDRGRQRNKYRSHHVIRKILTASHWSAADFGASNSVEQAYTSAGLGYVSPGRVTKSLGNSSPRFHVSTFESAMVFAAASGRARNLIGAHGGQRRDDCPFRLHGISFRPTRFGARPWTPGWVSSSA
jgi:hypothetical protein